FQCSARLISGRKQRRRKSTLRAVRAHRTEGTVCKSRLFIAVALAAGIAAGLRAQTTPLLPDAYFRAIRDESSGERPVIDFRTIESRYTGFTPSRGGDQIAEYLAGRMREY